MGLSRDNGRLSGISAGERLDGDPHGAQRPYVDPLARTPGVDSDGFMKRKPPAPPPAAGLRPVLHPASPLARPRHLRGERQRHRASSARPANTLPLRNRRPKPRLTPARSFRDECLRIRYGPIESGVLANHAALANVNRADFCPNIYVLVLGSQERKANCLVNITVGIRND
jgi:hypothetical protein